MEKDKYVAKIFEMGTHPETKINTVCLEIALNDLDFNLLKGRWVEADTVDLSFLND